MFNEYSVLYSDIDHLASISYLSTLWAQRHIVNLLKRKWSSWPAGVRILANYKYAQDTL